MSATLRIKVKAFYRFCRNIRFHEPKVNLGDKMAIKVYVKTMAGNTITVYTEESATVESLKLQIHDKEGIAVDQMRIVFGVLLEDGHSLRDYGIQNESIVHLVLKLRGGWRPEEDDDMGDKNGKNQSIEELCDFNRSKCTVL